jgi:hypothetical protein
MQGVLDVPSGTVGPLRCSRRLVTEVVEEEGGERERLKSGRGCRRRDDCGLPSSDAWERRAAPPRTTFCSLPLCLLTPSASFHSKTRRKCFKFGIEALTKPATPAYRSYPPPSPSPTHIAPSGIRRAQSARALSNYDGEIKMLEEVASSRGQILVEYGFVHLHSGVRPGDRPRLGRAPSASC